MGGGNINGRKATSFTEELDGIGSRLFREVFGHEYGHNDELEELIDRRESALRAEWAAEWAQELMEDVALTEGRLAADSAA